jgi:acyl-CoA synthetase (NDP forming)
MTVEMVGELARMGAGGAVCYAAGFAEVGGEGKELQKALVAAAGDLAVVGPNCYGLLNYVDGVAMFASGPGWSRSKGGVALVMQSGNIALNLTNHQRSVPLSYVITCGNQAVLDIADYIECLADDPHVTVIGLYMEGMPDAARFARAALKALKAGKPVVALKAGNSELGSKLAMSHTSSLAGNDKLYSTLFDRLGVVRVRELSELLETAKLLSISGAPERNRIVVFTCSGGDSLMTADRAAEVGVELPQFPAKTAASLRDQLPNFASVSNPLDYNTSLWGNKEKLEQCFETALHGDYDAAMLVIDFPVDDKSGYDACFVATDAVIRAGRIHGKPALVTSSLSELMPVEARDHVIKSGGTPLQGLQTAIDSFAGAARFGRRRGELTKPGAIEAALLPSLPPLPATTRLLGEAEGKAALKAHGLTVPEGRLVGVAEAASAATALGFPVVAKLAEPVLAHKTEAGAVKLNLKNAEDVKAALASITGNLERYRSGTRPERFLIERMVSDVVAELIVGVKRDPQFGLVLVVGAGGILVEMVEDAATLLLPTAREDVAKAIASLKVAKLLEGYRGKPAGDVEAAIDAVMAIATYAYAQRDKLAELDVNPLMVLPRGKGVMAVDALVVMGA